MHWNAIKQQVGEVGVPEAVERDAGNAGRHDLTGECLGEVLGVL